MRTTLHPASRAGRGAPRAPHVPCPRPQAAVALLVALAAGCEHGSASNPEVLVVDDGVRPDARPRDAGDADTPVAEEVCDGLDNDRDGLTDENTGGGTCAPEAGSEAGRLECVLGQLECSTCTPGETRRSPCACGFDRVDLCTVDGVWQEGDCDACEVEPRPCECRPGAEEFRRCDACAPGDPACGVTCIGARWRCSETTCQWEQVGDCEAREPECTLDDVIHQDCGRCGRQTVACDGCFWMGESCRDQGQCEPGETRATPCYGEACTPGFVGGLTCTETCEWETTSCTGCTLGERREEERDCVSGYALCGSVTDIHECETAETVAICGGASSLPRGEERVVETVGTCNTPCMPWETEACTTATGAAGYRRTCGYDCQPMTGECIPTGGSSSCTPGEVDEVPCGCGALRSRSCGAGGSWSGWDGSSCPPCSAGQTRTASCGGSGTCGGSRTDTCSSECAWVEGTCEAAPLVCTAGAREENVRGCGGACGVTYTEWRTCAANGCSWSSWDSDHDEICELECTPLETRTTDRNCNPAIPGCPNIVQQCTASCTWQDLPCAGDCG